MSKTVSPNMNENTNKVTDLWKEFASNYKRDSSKSNGDGKLLGKMRKIYGRAILDDFEDKKRIESKGSANVTDDDLIRLSANASFLHVIHSIIRRCEKMANGKTHSHGAINSPTTTDSDQQTEIQVPKSSVHPVFKQNGPNDTEELSLHGIQTETEVTPETESKFNFASLFAKSDKAQTGGVDDNSVQFINTENISEFINNINTSEAKNLMDQTSDNGKNGKNGKSEPTLLYFWSDQCKFSREFKPKWEEFKAKAHTLFPNLQIETYNIKLYGDLSDEDKQKKELVASMGIDAVPSIALYRNKKIHPMNISVANVPKTSVEDIKVFIKNMTQ